VSALAIAVRLYIAWRGGAFRALPGFEARAFAWVGLLGGTYLAGTILACLLTIAADLTRYNLPLYPMALAFAAPLVSVALAGRWALAGIAALAAVLAIHSGSLAATQPRAPDIVARQMLSSGVAPGSSAQAWLESHVPPRGVVVASSGQAVSYVLHRDVVSILSARYAARPVDENGFHDLMLRDRAQYLLLFPGMTAGEAGEQYDIPFIRRLTSGSDGAPGWLRQAVRNDAVAIYECASCVAPRKGGSTIE